MSNVYRANEPGRSGGGAASGDVGEQIKTLQSDISSLATQLGQMTRDAVTDTTLGVMDTANEKTEQYQAYVRKNPGQAALAAAGVGFVIGLLLSR